VLRVVGHAVNIAHAHLAHLSCRHSKAQFSLALCLEHGEGVKQDIHGAIDWYSI